MESSSIDLEGYAYVKIASFEKIVDLLGGVSIKISKEEADYLNSTNYITNPKNRNLVAGTNHMNGNQVLAYTEFSFRPLPSSSSTYISRRMEVSFTD